MDIPLIHGHASVAQTQKDCNDCQISLHEHFVLQHLNQSIIYLVRKANKDISVLADSFLTKRHMETIFPAVQLLNM